MRDFKTDRMSRWEKWQSYLRSLKGYGMKSTFAQTKALALFIGYPRSGHTLIGSLLDAHRNTVIAHEMDVLYYFQKGYSLSQVYFLLLDNAQKFTQSGREWMGYNYRVPEQWQGKHETIQLIGDKSGGRTTRRLQLLENMALLEKIQQKAGAQLVFIHIIRNPFDIITTMMKRTTTRREIDITDEQLELKTRHFFKHVASVDQLKKSKKYRIIDIYHEGFVANPTAELKHLCTSLDLEPHDDYIRDCAALVWKKARQSRHGTDLWTEERIARVEAKIKEYDFLKKYTFSEV